ncbi:hypothetical protein DFP91_5285 [Pseudorhodoplanes sinuspersici]|nr:hypothetical protein DFP91_5285 [Pseudorhodoplanes sinuspersici]
MLTKMITDVVRSQLNALIAFIFTLQPQQRRQFVPMPVRARIGEPRRIYTAISEEPRQ